MGENEKIVSETITKILQQLKEKLKEEGVPVYSYTFHLDKIKYIESNKPNEIILEYPLEKGTYHNWTEIKIMENGTVNIHGTETSPERRNEYVKGNGGFDINLQLDNWKEPDTMDIIRNEQLGHYEPEKGLLDNDGNLVSKVNTNAMREGISKKFPELDDQYSTFSIGGLPNVPCLEQFEDGTELLIISPEDAVKIINAGSQEALFCNVEHFGNGDLFDYTKADIDGVYVLNQSEIEGENKNYDIESFKSALLKNLEYVSYAYEDEKGEIQEDLDIDTSVLKYINSDVVKDEGFKAEILSILGKYYEYPEEILNLATEEPTIFFYPNYSKKQVNYEIKRKKFDDFIKKHIKTLREFPEDDCGYPLAGFGGLLPNLDNNGNYIGIAPKLETNSQSFSDYAINSELEKVLVASDECHDMSLAMHSEKDLLAVLFVYYQEDEIKQFDIVGIYNKNGDNIWPEIIEAYCSGKIQLSDKEDYYLSDIEKIYSELLQSKEITLQEITEMISDRKSEDINKVVAEISEEMKDKSKENGQTKEN